MLNRSIFYLFCFLYLVPSWAGDSVRVSLSVKYRKGFIHSLLFGKHYRSIWGIPVEVKVFHAGKEHGGLKPIKEGGNSQTHNLRLENSEGKEFVLRSIHKDPAKGFPPIIRNSFLGPVFRDQNTAENPFAPMVIAILAEALDIYHTNPQIVFIPYDTLLQPYAREFGNDLALFEERPKGNHSQDPFFGNAPDVVSTKKMLKEVYKDNRNLMDEKLYARCRLFDMLISDWGRHEDQWRWGEFCEEDKVIYKPIPRDRDHAFYLFDDGLIPWMYINFFGGKFQSFTPHFKNIRKLNLSATYLDDRFLNSLSKSQWLSIAHSIQRSLTDSIIEAAVKKMPAEIFSKVGDYTIKTLKSRRDKLDKAALEYYGILSESIEVAGSDESEKFIVGRLEEGKTSLTVLRASGDTIFHRIVENKETQMIKLFGLGGKDTFEVRGTASSGPLIEVVGGEGGNVYNDSSFVTGKGYKNIYFGQPGDVALSARNETRILFPPPERMPQFDRKGFNKEMKKQDEE